MLPAARFSRARMLGSRNVPRLRPSRCSLACATEYTATCPLELVTVADSHNVRKVWLVSAARVRFLSQGPLCMSSPYHSSCRERGLSDCREFMSVGLVDCPPLLVTRGGGMAVCPRGRGIRGCAAVEAGSLYRMELLP